MSYEYIVRPCKNCKNNECCFKGQENNFEVCEDYTATNGDLIKALFPNGKVIETEDGDIGYEICIDKDYSFCSWFDGTWWNAPYKKEVK